MPAPPFDLPQAHRWFAVESNNTAWDLVEAPSRTPDETERMIHAAHAAGWHWLQVGTPLHHLRAACLLATAYAVAGHPEAAVRHAERCCELSDQVGAEQTDFDRATAFGCAARAYAVAGRLDEARRRHHEALEAASALDSDDRSVFDKLYPPPEVIPAPSTLLNPEP